MTSADKNADVLSLCGPHQVAALQQQCKKALSEIFGLFRSNALSPYETINWSPVRAAKFFERLLRRWCSTLRRQHHAPVRGCKRDRAVICISANRGQGSHLIVSRGHAVIQSSCHAQSKPLFVMSCPSTSLRTGSVETSMAMPVLMLRHLICSLPVRSASGLPVDLAASPGRSVLHFGRNDRLLGTRLRLRIAKRLQCCDAGRSTADLRASPSHPKASGIETRGCA